MTYCLYHHLTRPLRHRAALRPLDWAIQEDCEEVLPDGGILPELANFASWGVQQRAASNCRGVCSLGTDPTSISSLGGALPFKKRGKCCLAVQEQRKEMSLFCLILFDHRKRGQTPLLARVKRCSKVQFTHVSNNKFALMLNMLHCILTYFLYKNEHKTSSCYCQHLLMASRGKDEMWLLEDYSVV